MTSPPDTDGEAIVIDDDALVRATVCNALQTLGLQARGFASAQAFLDAPPPRRPACLIVDMRMPRITGLALLHALREAGDAPPVIVITGFADVPMTADIFRAGAFDFLPKPFSINALLELAARAIDRDRQDIAVRRRDDAARDKLAALTPREREVAERLLQGQTSKEIARDLAISPRTVEHHRSRAMEKLAVRNAAELAALFASNPHRTG